MMNGDGGNHEINRPGGEAVLSTLLAQPGCFSPQFRRGWEERKCGELCLDPFPFLIRGVSENLKRHRFTETSIRIEQEGLNELLE